METEVFDSVLHLQQQLARSIDARNIQDSYRIIEILASPELVAQFPNSLNWYMCSHQQLTPLLHAITKGQEEVALFLLQRGCDPNTDKSSHKCSALKAGDTQISRSMFKVLEKPGFERVLRIMLEKCEKLSVDTNGDTVLHIIAKRKLILMLEVVFHCKWLSQMLKHFNNQGMLPMHLAAGSNFLQFFQVLYHTDCPTIILKTNVQSGLIQHHNCVTDTCDLMNNIREARKNLNINSYVKVSKTTALHISASERFVTMVELLLKLGANVNATDHMGKTPLVECLDQRGEKRITQTSSNDLLQVCRLLLQAGANVNVRSHIQYSERRSMANDDVLTPLHLAGGIGSTDVVELLLNNGADPKVLSGDIGKIPLQFALEQSHNEVAMMLLSTDLYPEGFLGNHVDYAFNSLLHSADRCDPEVIRKLIHLSCSLDRPNVNHLRPLDKAISSKNLAFIELLLSTQPQIVNVHLYQDPMACPPLHLAASSLHPKLCQILLSYGADIYSRAFGKHMAYRKAWKFNRYETAVYLFEQMSRPFSKADIQEINIQAIGDVQLSRRLQSRLEEVPTLVSMCLDSVRKIFIRNYYCFKNIHKLPVPETVIKALRYQNTNDTLTD